MTDDRERDDPFDGEREFVARDTTTERNSPTLSVVTAVSELNGVDPSDAPPITESVDPEALDRLFDGRDSGTVTFEYGGYEVVVSADGRIRIRDRVSE